MPDISYTGTPFLYASFTLLVVVLRAMYFMLADVAGRFHLLGYGLAAIVTLVGVKMMIMGVFRVPQAWMLLTVAGLLVLSVVASMRVPAPKKVAKPPVR